MFNIYYDYYCYLYIYHYLAQDYGLEWSQTQAPFVKWKSVALDNTGQYVAVTQYTDSSGNDPGYVFTSSNGMMILKVASFLNL